MFPRVSLLDASLTRDGKVADSNAAERRAEVCQDDEASRERMLRSRGEWTEGRPMGTIMDACW